MNAIELLLPSGKSSGVFACEQCRCVTKDQESAETCCSPLSCKFCGEPTGNKRSFATQTEMHAECWERNLVAKAEKLEAWDGWVYWTGHGGNNGYFESVDEFVDFLAGEYETETEWPEWVFVCEQRAFPKVDIDRIISDVVENLYEGFDGLSGKKKLGLAIDAFNAAVEGLVSYEWNMKRVVRVPRGES